MFKMPGGVDGTSVQQVVARRTGEKTTVKRSRVLRSHTFDGQRLTVPTNVWSEVVEQPKRRVDRFRANPAAGNQGFATRWVAQRPTLFFPRS
jgi:hypothetical protein